MTDLMSATVPVIVVMPVALICVPVLPSTVIKLPAFAVPVTVTAIRSDVDVVKPVNVAAAISVAVAVTTPVAVSALMMLMSATEVDPETVTASEPLVTVVMPSEARAVFTSLAVPVKAVMAVAPTATPVLPSIVFRSEAAVEAAAIVTVI